MKEYFKKHWKIILGLLALNIGLFAYNFLYERVDGNSRVKYFPWLLASQIIAEIILALFIGFVSKRKWKIEKIFLALFIPLGILHAVITPLNQVCDEDAHMLRAYEISKGKISPKSEKGIGVTGDFPVEVWNAMYFWEDDDKQYNRLLENVTLEESGVVENRQYSNAAGYLPISYIPQILGLLTGRVLHLPIVMQFYLARIFSVLFFAIVVYFAIKIVPKYKEFFVFVSLLPMVLTQAASFSADAVLIASSFLFLATVLHEIYRGDEKLSKKNLVIMVISGALMSVIKQGAYLPLALLVLLIPTKKFDIRQLCKKYKKPLIFALIAVPIIALCCLPLKFLNMSFGTIFGTDPFDNLDTIFGSRLVYGHVDAPIKIYPILALVFAVILLVKNVEVLEVKIIEKLIFALAPIIITLAIYYIAYSSWGTFKDDGRVIESVHGRYFLPFLPLIPFIVQPKKPYTSEKVSTETVMLFGVFANFAVLGSKLLFNL